MKAITVAGFPAISKESYLKNLSRTPETGKPLIALAGDIVQENSTFTLDKMGDSLADKKVSVALPENVTYEKGSLSLNGTVIPDDDIQNGISIPTQYLAKAGDKVTITYKYKINPITATTNAIDLPTKPAVLSGNIALSDGTKLPFTEVKTDTNLIQIPKQELALQMPPPILPLAVIFYCQHKQHITKQKVIFHLPYGTPVYQVQMLRGRLLGNYLLLSKIQKEEN